MDRWMYCMIFVYNMIEREGRERGWEEREDGERGGMGERQKE